jgi:transcriptional regulator with XRE-family HTH domain
MSIEILDNKDSERLKTIRSALGLSQAKLAKSLEIKVSRIRDVEVGKIRLSVDVAKLIEEKFHYSFKWLLTGKGDMLATQENNLKINRKDSITEKIVVEIKKLPKNKKIIALRIAETFNDVIEEDMWMALGELKKCQILEELRRGYEIEKKAEND